MGAMVFGKVPEETIIFSRAGLFMPLNKPLQPVDTASHLDEIRKMISDGQYQKAAEFVVELSHEEGWGAKRWTDPLVPAFDLIVNMEEAGEIKNYMRSVDFQTGVVSVSWEDNRGKILRRLFVSLPDNVAVFSIKGTTKRKN